MNCPSCEKEVSPDSFFCNWCDTFIPSPQKGKKANLFTRLMAWAMDIFLIIVLWILAIIIAGGPMQPAGSGATIGGINIALLVFLSWLIYLVWFLLLLRKGKTPGKKIFRIQVINQQSGDIPGFQKMFLREIVGRFLSGLFFGLGYFWALIDKNAQAWHDKLAGTVVIKLRK